MITTFGISRIRVKPHSAGAEWDPPVVVEAAPLDQPTTSDVEHISEKLDNRLMLAYPMEAIAGLEKIEKLPCLALKRGSPAD